MAKVLLQGLKLKNFKGMKAYEVKLKDDLTQIFGDNATGKTTLFDAYCWLFNGKDSKNQADFDIKTLDAEGNEIHGLEHEVEGKFLIDGVETTLTRTYLEKWETKRGQAEATFNGHKTKYKINGVPKAQKEFDAFIANIATDEQLKLLTNPVFFNDDKAFPWKKRRELLIAVCGNVEDSEVIEGNKKLLELKAILNTRSIDDYRAIIAERKKVVQEEMDKLPVRIDELTMGLSENVIDEEAVNKQLAELLKEKIDKETAILNLINDAAIIKKKAEISKIDNQIMQIKNTALQNQNEKQQESMKVINKLTAELSKINASIMDYDYRLKNNNKTLESMNRIREAFVSQYTTEYAKNFDSEAAAACPTCGQIIPEEKLLEAQETFNKARSEMLAKITLDGQNVKAEIDAVTTDNTKIEDEKTELSTQKHNLELLIKEQKAVSNELAKPDQEDEQQKLLSDQKAALQVDINTIMESKQEVVSQMRENVQELENQIQTLRNELATEESQKKSKKRIEDLKAEQKKLAAEYSQLDKALFLTEEFIKTKVSMLEEKINSRFMFVNFKLFEMQLNGGLNEVCKATLKGVPFNSMNDAAKIIIGIDIINTLSKHFNFYSTIFIDNAEAITVLPHSDSQIVALYVNEEDKTLRVGE